ncbi:MAG: MoaD/ThiS family protein [Dehalococcoidia bacterium]
MRVTVRLHGEYTHLLGNGRDRGDVEAPEGATVRELLALLGLPREEFWLNAVNGAVVPPETTLCAGDTLECVAPMSGG